MTIRVSPTHILFLLITFPAFGKTNNASTGGSARPNLLVGHWPLSGSGSSDIYLIYGNFFYENPTQEALFQGTGNIALYDNLFASTDDDAAVFQPYEGGDPQLIRAFNNTIVSAGTGPPLDTSSFNTFTNWNKDFNFATHDGTFRGAYAVECQNPGWLPQLDRKPLAPPVEYSEFVNIVGIFK